MDTLFQLWIFVRLFPWPRSSIAYCSIFASILTFKRLPLQSSPPGVYSGFDCFTSLHTNALFRHRIYGAAERIRTPALLITNQLLYQLSYSSMSRAAGIPPETMNLKGAHVWGWSRFNLQNTIFFVLFKPFNCI